ncbi:MAG: cupin domain-containing protein [Flavobacteriaceae bacterium]
MKVINILEKYTAFDAQWSPHVIAELNGQQVLLAKIQGEFVWHAHAEEDELFHVVKGQLRMEFRDRIEVVNPGEIIVIPKGVEHRPCAEEETWILLFEPLSTKHTGEVVADITKSTYPRI